MIISDEMNETKIDTLSVQIERVISSDPELTHTEILTACMNTVGSVLASVTCPDCRKLAALSLETGLPGFIKHALAEAEKRGGEPPASGHIH